MQSKSTEFTRPKSMSIQRQEKSASHEIKHKAYDSHSYIYTFITTTTAHLKVCFIPYDIPIWLRHTHAQYIDRVELNSIGAAYCIV